MPEEAFVLIMMSILAGSGLLVFLVLQIFSYAKSRNAGATGANSLGKSELETMLRRIVRDELTRAGSGPGSISGNISGSEAGRRDTSLLLEEGDDTLDADLSLDFDEFKGDRLGIEEADRPVRRKTRRG